MTRAAKAFGLGVLWTLVNGAFTPASLLVGWLLGYMILTFTARAPAFKDTLRHPLKLASLLVRFLWALLVSNLKLAAIVVSPRLDIHPGVVAVPLDARTDLEVTLLANLVTLTPGTMSVEVSDDRRVLFVHGIDVRDKDAFIAAIKEGFERRVLEALR